MGEAGRTRSVFGRYSGLKVTLATAIVVGGTAGLVVAVGAPVAANTPAYAVYCPRTPVGDVVMNDTVTTGTITPSAGTFSVTDYQDRVTIPPVIVSAAVALGNTAIAGTVTAKVDATGATPASISTGALKFNVPIPSPVPPKGLLLAVPSKPKSIGPFTATASTVTVTSDKTLSVTLIISGSPLALTCTDYPNNTLPSGIVSGPPTVPPISPVIATTATPIKVTARPSKGLADGQTIAVAGSGFSPGASIAIIECQTGSTTESGCDLSTVKLLPANAKGGFLTPYIVSRLIMVGGTRLDCASTPTACILGAANISDQTQHASTPLGFNPKIPVLPPLKLSGTLNATGTVVNKTGVATISGTMRCNRPIVANIEGELSQIYERFIFRSDSSGSITCSPKTSPTRWSLTFQPETGLFANGPASVQATISGSVEGTTSQVSLAGPVQLKQVQ
jgi:hypothetical protein